MNGIIVVNKPKGITSRDVVNKVCKILNTKKVGHSKWYFSFMYWKCY